MKTLKERIEEYLSGTELAGPDLLREAHAALTAPVEGDLNALADYLNSTGHRGSSDTVRAAGRRIAELERELAEWKYAAENYRDDALKSAARVAELERDLAAVTEQRDRALERAKAAEKEARFHADGWAVASECAKAAAKEKGERQAREIADLLPHHAMKLDGRTILEWKQRAEWAEKELAVRTSPPSRIEGRTHEQTHARLVDAERELMKAEQRFQSLKSAGLHLGSPNASSFREYAARVKSQTPDPAFEARKEDVINAMRYVMANSSTCYETARVVLKFLESLPSPEAPAKREVTEEDRHAARLLRTLLRTGRISLLECCACKRAADLLDGGERR